MFENDVKTYGTETLPYPRNMLSWFENDVKTYGTETSAAYKATSSSFENAVKTYGTETVNSCDYAGLSLRMM